MKYMTIKELPESERPYEKCEKYGASVLSDSELLAIIIKSGNRNERSTDLASRILMMKESRYGLNVLNHVSMKELCSINGIGKVKAIQLMAVAELSKRMAEDIKREGITFEDSDSIAGFYMEKMRHLEREQTRLLLFDMRMKMISDLEIFKGPPSGASPSLCSCRGTARSPRAPRCSRVSPLHVLPFCLLLSFMQPRFSAKRHALRTRRRARCGYRPSACTVRRESRTRDAP